MSPVYCGDIVADNWMQRLYATTDGVEVWTFYQTPTRPGFPQIWREHAALRSTLREGQLLEEITRLADGEQVANAVIVARALAAHRRIRRESCEVVLGPGEWTHVELAGDPS